MIAGAVCAVTGASGGIGRAIAQAVAADGAAVVGFARRFQRPTVDEAPRPGHVLEVRLDVTREADVVARFAELGAVDVLVNSAGTGTFAPIDELDAAALRAMLDVHVVGTALCTREAVRGMRARRRGHVVTIASTACVELFPGSAGYTAAKRAQLGLVRVAGKELRGDGVRFTAVLAGAVDTAIWDARPGYEQVDRTRMLRPAQLAAVVVDVLRRPELCVDELLVRPPGGDL